MRNINIPYVIEQHGREERVYDLFSRLLKDRIIFIGDEINAYVHNIVVGQLLFLQQEDRNRDIHIYVNSPGGHISAGLGIYDTMQFVTCPIATYCVGSAASMGAFLLAAGTKGKRFALPNARIMIHQPWGGFQGTASDISIHAREILHYKKRLTEILAKHTGQSEERIEKDCDRDYFMSPEEAKGYGLVDEVIQSAAKLPGAPA